MISSRVKVLITKFGSSRYTEGDYLLRDRSLKWLLIVMLVILKFVRYDFAIYTHLNIAIVVYKTLLESLLSRLEVSYGYSRRPSMLAMNSLSWVYIFLVLMTSVRDSEIFGHWYVYS